MINLVRNLQSLLNRLLDLPLQLVGRIPAVLAMRLLVLVSRPIPCATTPAHGPRRVLLQTRRYCGRYLLRYAALVVCVRELRWVNVVACSAAASANRLPWRSGIWDGRDDGVLTLEILP